MTSLPDLRRIRNLLILIAAGVWLGSIVMTVLLAQIGAELAH